MIFGIRAVRARRAVVMISVVALALTGAGAGAASAASDGPVTLRVAQSVDVGGVQDPHTYTGSLILLDMIFEPLVSYGEGGTLEPTLAESWEVSDDGLTVTFHLRQGVTFHDGTPFDAEAVKWNFDRWVGDEDHNFIRTSEVISDVRVVDDATVELVLSEPYPPLLQELTIVRPVRFLSPASVGPDGKFTEAVGTGPWLLESVTQTGAALVRYDGYWGEKPSIDRVEFEVIPDSQTRVSALRAGEVDLIGGNYLAPITPVEAQALQSTEGVQLLVGEPDTSVVLAFNTDGPLADRAVRQAVAQAVDRDALNAALYAGFGQPVDTFFPPSIPDSGVGMDISFDPDAARRMLDEAGWVLTGEQRVKDGEPLQLELLVPSEAAHGLRDSRTAAAAVAAALEEVGIGVTIEAVEAAAYNDEIPARNWDLTFMESFGAPYDPSSSTVYYFTKVGGGYELWTAPALDELVEAAIFATDDERAAAYQAVYDYLEGEAAFLPLTQYSRLWAVGPSVSGFEVPVTETDLDLSAVTVSR